jgi:hypothetical protein
MKRSTTPTFLLELPLRVDAGQVRRLSAHFEAARCLYNALLGEAMKRLQAMRADPAWQEARAVPRSHKQERKQVFSRLRRVYGFSEYALHEFVKLANCSWIADHIDAMLAQTLATRAYQAANRVCLGQAKKVRFRSTGRGLDSVENKWNRSGLRFALQAPEEGNQGWLVWGKDRVPALIDWDDPVVHHGLRHPIKYARLIRRKASSPDAQGADVQGYRYYAQLVLEGKPHQKKKHAVGTGIIGLDLGPSTIAIVPREGEVQLLPLCEELKPDARAKRRLERKLDRQRRTSNPQNYDEKGRVKKRGKGKQRLTWKNSKGYLATRRRLSSKERKLAAHRKSLHGRLVHEIVRRGNDIHIEKISYRAWQKRYGKSVGRNAPGMFLDHLRRTVASTGGTLSEFPTRTTKLSQYCHGCKTYVKKPLSQRWHHCACGIGPVQRDLYSAFLAAHLDSTNPIPSIAHDEWEGADLRLCAAVEVLQQRAKEGQSLPRSVGISRAGARLPESLTPNRLELVYRHGRLEALG